MRILLKLVAAPILLILTMFAAIIKFLLTICSFLLTILSVITTIVAIGLFFTSTPLGGIVFLILAFLLSPYGLQAMASSLIGMLYEGKNALGKFLLN